MHARSLTCRRRAGSQGTCSRAASPSASICHTTPTRRASGRAALAKRSQIVQRVSGSLNAAMETKMAPDLAPASPGCLGSACVGSGGGAAENHTVSANLCINVSVSRMCHRLVSMRTGGKQLLHGMENDLAAAPVGMCWQHLMRHAALESHQPVV